MSSPAGGRPAPAWLAAIRTCATTVTHESSKALFDEAYREHVQRPARAIIQQGNADPEQQEV
jgi:hypothetical protein